MFNIGAFLMRISKKRASFQLTAETRIIINALLPSDAHYLAKSMYTPDYQTPNIVVPLVTRTRT